MVSFEDAYARATAEQGLLPALNTLRAHGIHAVAENTGGWCMVLFVNGPDGRCVGITAGDVWEPDYHTDGYLVMGYTNEAGVYEGDGDTLAERAQPAELPAFVRGWLK